MCFNNSNLELNTGYIFAALICFMVVLSHWFDMNILLLFTECKDRLNVSLNCCIGVNVSTVMLAFTFKML